MLYSTAVAAQRAGRAARLIRGPRPFFPCQVTGPALPCKCAPGDNLALHRAIVEAEAGAVIVCDAQGRDDVAHFGELMALECLRRKIAGLVINGAVRDTAALERIGLPVFCTVVCPLPPAKEQAGHVGRTITMGGIRVTAGDQIIADRDGVLLIRRADWPRVLSAMKQTQAREKEVRRRMRAGEPLEDILKLKV
ncbi:MAG: RraA family protein [Terriglobales bacterium]